VLKGLADPVQAWQVLDASAVQSRFHRCIRRSPKISGDWARRKSRSGATLFGIYRTARRIVPRVR
jgi:hypothetical protein